MPESDERELGGLARSIDALFSRQGRTPAFVAAEPESWQTVESEPEQPAVAEPDPFESLAVHVPETTESDLPSQASHTEVDAQLEADWQSPAPEHVSATGGLDFAEPEGADTGLEDAVEAFLRGDPGAADEVRSISAKLKERLALDPLADAVERLVHAESASSNDETVALAQEVMNPAVASRLVQRMGHEEDEEKRAAYVVLSQRLGMVMARAFRGALTGATAAPARRAYYDALIAMKETTRPLIEAMVEDDNRFLVLNAVAILGEMGGDRAIEIVTSALANTDARVRCEALSSLTNLGVEGADQLVLASLEDPDPKVRAAAAMAAGELGIERGLKPILGLLEAEDDPAVLVTLLASLGHLGDPGAVLAIEKRALPSLFSKPTTEVRVAAYRALHEIGTPHARDLLQRARDDKDPVVRTTARGLAPAE
jgi:HEAT repeat protein